MALDLNPSQLQIFNAATLTLNNTATLVPFRIVTGDQGAVVSQQIQLQEALARFQQAQERGEADQIGTAIDQLNHATTDLNLAAVDFVNRGATVQALQNKYGANLAGKLQIAARLFANSSTASASSESDAHLDRLLVQVSWYVTLFKEAHPTDEEVSNFETALTLLESIVNEVNSQESAQDASTTLTRLKQKILERDPSIEEKANLRITLAEKRRERSIQAQPWFEKLSQKQKENILEIEASYADNPNLFFSYVPLTTEAYEKREGGTLKLNVVPIVDMHVFSETEDGNLKSEGHYRIDNMGEITTRKGLNARKPDGDAFTLSPVQNNDNADWPRITVLYTPPGGKATAIGLSVACNVRTLSSGKSVLTLNVLSRRSGLDYTKFSGRTEMMLGALQKAIEYWKNQHPDLEVAEIQWWLSSGDRKMISNLATAATEEEKKLASHNLAKVLGDQYDRRIQANPSIGVRFGVGNSSPGRVLAELGFQKIRWSNPDSIRNGIGPKTASDSPANVMFVAYKSDVPDYPEAPFKRGVDALSLGAKVYEAMDNSETGAKYYPFTQEVKQTLENAQKGDSQKGILPIPGVVKGYEELNRLRSDPQIRAIYEENLAKATLLEMEQSPNTSIRELAKEGRILDPVRLRVLVRYLKTVGIETVRIENKLYSAEEWVAKFADNPAVFVDNTLVEATHSAYIHISSIARDIDYLRRASGIGENEDLSKIPEGRWILSPRNYMKSLYLKSITVRGNGFSSDPNATRDLTLWDILHDIFDKEASQAYQGYDGKSYLAAIPESDWAVVGAIAGYRSSGSDSNDTTSFSYLEQTLRTPSYTPANLPSPPEPEDIWPSLPIVGRRGPLIRNEWQIEEDPSNLDRAFDFGRGENEPVSDTREFGSSVNRGN